MANILVELLRRIVVQLDIQSQAIQQLTHSQVHLTQSQQKMIDRSENILQMHQDFSSVQNQILEGQRLLMEKIEHLTKVLDALQQQVDFQSELSDFSKLVEPDPVYGLLDVYFNDLKALKQRIIQLESYIGKEPPHSAF